MVALAQRGQDGRRLSRPGSGWTGPGSAAGWRGGGVGTARLSAGTEMLWIYDLAAGDYLAVDSSIGENGYPQPYGARAVIVTIR